MQMLPADCPPTPPVQAAHATTLPRGSVTKTGDTVHMTGDADRAAVRFLRSRPALDGVTTVDLTHADYLDGDALHLLLRCLRQLHDCPGAQDDTRLRVIGADDRVRRHLEMFGVTDLIAFTDPTDQ